MFCLEEGEASLLALAVVGARRGGRARARGGARARAGARAARGATGRARLGGASSGGGGEEGLTSSKDLVEGLALELLDELVEAGLVGLDANGVEDLGDVGGGGLLVAGDGGEEVGGNVLHTTN